MTDAELSAVASNDALSRVQEMQLLLSPNEKPGASAGLDQFISLVRELNEAYEAGSRSLGEAIIEASSLADAGDIEAAKTVYERFLATCKAPFYRRIAQIQLNKLS